MMFLLKCQNYEGGCRKDRAHLCPRFLCATCCDRSSPCCGENHNKRRKARGTSKPSEAKIRRRCLHESVMEIIKGLTKNRPWFLERLQISGYTVRKFTWLLYDHMVWMVSEENNSDSTSEEANSASKLSFTIPPAELSLVEEEVELIAKTVTKNDLVQAREREEDANQEFNVPQRNEVAIQPAILESIRVSFGHILNQEEKSDRISWRKLLVQHLQSPPSKRLLQYGQSVGLTDEAIVRLVDKVCPLSFVDERQYHNFSDALAARVRENLWKFRDRLMSTAAGSLNGFQLIFGGTAATLFSEDPGVKQGRLFDQNGTGTSDLDVAIVFESAQSHLHAEVFTQAIFFGTPSCSKYFKDIQYARPQVTTRFQLEAGNFLSSWRRELGRDVNVIVAFSSRTHGNGVLTFYHHYDFSWESVEDTESASSTPVSSVYNQARTTASLEDLMRPEPKNRFPLKYDKHQSPVLVQSHYQRAVPKLFKASSRQDVRDLDREMNTAGANITFENMEKWLQARGIFECFRDVSRQAYDWKLDPREPHRHSHGVWFKCVLKPDAVYPALSQSKIGITVDDKGNIVMPTPRTRKYARPLAFVKAIHASSMYSVAIIIAKGLTAGPASKNKLKGIYCSDMNNYKLAMKSSGYAVHSELFEDNIYWAPFYELQVARFMGGETEIGKITAGDQWVCKEELSSKFGPMFHLTAVWFHALPQCDLEDVKNHLWVSLDRFDKEFELDPNT